MKYENPQLRDQLAAEYVMGTLSGRVRARFQRLLKYDVALRHNVTAWETRLTPLADTVPEVAPPARVWRAILARIANDRAQAGLRTRFSLDWWRRSAAFSAALVIVMAIVLVTRPPAEAPVDTVAVLTDAQAQPMMVISWPRQHSGAQPHLKVKLLAQPTLPPGKSFELWMLPGGKAAPVSLGVISIKATQTIPVSASASQMLPKISGMAVSIEPAGGSPTGAPTGPVIMSGPSVKIG